MLSFPVGTMSLIEHIQSRLGMYVPTDDGKPTKAVWDMLLYELTAFGVRAFSRGETMRIEIDYNHETGMLSINHEDSCADILGLVSKALDSVSEELGALCRDRAAQAACYTRYCEMIFPIVNALSAKLVVEAFHDGEWTAVICRNGNVGPIERLVPELADSSWRHHFCIRFKIDPRYLPEDETGPYAEDGLQDFGDGLACTHPGLCVVVNGSEHLHLRGMVDFVTDRLGGDHEGILMEPKTFHCGDVSVSCGARKRKDVARRIFSQMFINGRRVQSTAILAMLSELVCDWIGDARKFQNGGYELVFAVSGTFPYDVQDFSDLDRILYVSDGAWRDMGAFRDNTMLSHLVSTVKRCMIDAFAGIQR